ncbi:TPA: DNA methyltransferase [Streptococcus mutans]|nr:DNA methyltransferase [Streptococcus mutans]MCB5112953.1 N-6 DNA methylase [Streptococcus mutans]NLQ71026.1 class I SAM-dependent DNA methyltransferase [Streptococcus mutans]
MSDKGNSNQSNGTVMTLKEQKKQAKEFIARWKDRGNERQDSQPFWLDILQSVYGIKNPTEYITFEDKVMLDHTSFIDGYIEKTKVLIEQKGKDKDLTKAIKQSDGTFLTPFQQAKRYSANLPYSKRPRWIVTSNFKEFFVYDMEQPNAEAIVIKLEDLADGFYRLEFLVDKSNEHLEREIQISMQAGDIVREIYDGLLKQYISPDSLKTLHDINQLIVRLVFCLYAEDSGLFGHKMAFHDYLERFESRDFRKALIELFEVLDTPNDKRDPYLDDELASFPYVNGGMFAEKNIEIPKFTDELRELLLQHASSGFDWSDISPTIFGAVFESTLNPETRRSGGMHYTSIENIHKVIDPLFLNDLKDELNEIRQFKQIKTVEQRAKQFQSKLASLTFFDPACGSGNFLTETYISLRKLENEAIKLYMGDNIAFDLGQDLVKVKLNQFYGIEINDFAVSVAKTALWIAESQMLEATKEIVYAKIDFLPLKSYTNIVEGNALTLDWEEVVPKDKLKYIIGNPPFVGIRHSKENHRQQLKEVVSVIPKSGGLDYVTAWYVKALHMMERNSQIMTAFVSTNSIVQGEQATTLWEYILKNKNGCINFAYKSFIWNSEVKNKASVHCVIIGFSMKRLNESILFDGDTKIICKNINQYLLPSKNTWIKKARKPLTTRQEMQKGCYPTDGGNYIFTLEEKENFINQEPSSEPYFRRWIGSEDMLNGKERYILFLKDCSPSELRKMPKVLEKVQAVVKMRKSSSKLATQKKADTPLLLDEERIPENDFLVIPVVSSENRKYIPIAYHCPPDICYASCFFIDNADFLTFGLLMSGVHNAFMRTVSGRLKSDYRYSNTLVYNNFPIPDLDEKLKEKIEKTAQAILEARKLYSESTLADLYDELAMPAELRRAHQANDKAVMEAYGMTKELDGKKTWLTESETVAKLFEMYEEMTK